MLKLLDRASLTFFTFSQVDDNKDMKIMAYNKCVLCHVSRVDRKTVHRKFYKYAKKCNKILQTCAIQKNAWNPPHCRVSDTMLIVSFDWLQFHNLLVYAYFYAYAATTCEFNITNFQNQWSEDSAFRTMYRYWKGPTNEEWKVATSSTLKL